MNHKINVLHVVQHATGGGIIRQLFNLLQAYDKETISPMVCCIGSKGTTGKRIEASGIEFKALNMGRNDRLIPRVVILLCGLMKQRQIHIVRTHGYGANLNGRIAALLCGIPCVPSVHNVYTKERKIHRRIANNLLGRITDNVVAVSEAVREDVIRFDRVDQSKIMVLRNGVDTEMFRPEEKAEGIRRELDIGDNDRVIGFVGRLVPAKGLTYLIEAFADLKKEIGHVKLLIVGRGALLGDLREMAAEKALQDDIIFTGERSDISAILSCLDMFVMSSEREGLPNALLEAMAVGIPPIVTTAGGMREVVQDGVTGLVVPVADSAALSLGIKRLLQDKDSARAMGRAARAHIENNFSIRATAHLWEELYKEMLKKKDNVAKAGWPGGRDNAE